ncbi:MAG: tRNA pseudouridine(38-40) synthase TruA [Thermodesulfobacteriota bacterium]
MRKIKLIIAYDGRSFSGWQRQKKAASIQAALEQGLNVLTRENLTVHSAGRTDAGVHAEAMPVHFITSSAIPCQAFKKGLNSILPGAIRIVEADEMPGSFHARYDALGKVYHYYFSNSETMYPMRRYYCAHAPRVKNIEKMTSCLEILIGRHDFSCFEATGSRNFSSGRRGAIREIFSADIISYNKQLNEYRFEIYGQGFLRKMVRNIMGTLFMAGRNKLSLADFKEVLLAGDRKYAGPTAPACGLFLHKVYY